MIKKITLTVRNKKIRLVVFLVLLFSPFFSYSTHIVGGELNYKCLGGNQYQITLTVYRDCYNGVPPFDNPAAIGIFDNNNVLVTTVFLPFPGSTVLPPTVAQANVCVKTPTNICVEVAKYVGTVTLPPRAGGYQLAYQRCCRNSTISNIVNPGNTGATYYARIPDQSVACNSNPVFKNYPPIFVCANNQIVFDHSATDADGDVIVYSLCAPLDGGTTGNTQPNPPSAPPYNPVTFKAPYTGANPFGGVSPLTIDPNTGLMTGTPTTLGQFVVGVCADEYRGGVLISTTKRDFQFNVINCQPDIVAASVHAISNCTNHTVTFTNKSTGSSTFFWNFGDLTTLGDTSHLQHPSYTYPAVGTYTVSLVAFSSLNSKCNDTLKNYVVNVTSCPPCTMTLGISKVDATCGSAGCTKAPPVLDTQNGKTIGAGNPPSDSTTLSWTHTVTAGGVNRLLIVQLSSMTVNATSVKYNGIPLTLLTQSTNGTFKAEMWYLLAPPTGANMILVTYPAGSGTFNPEKRGESFSFTGVDQVSPFNTPKTTTGTACPANFTVASGANELVIDMIVKDWFDAPTVNTGVSPAQVQKYSRQIGFDPGCGGSLQPGVSPTVTSSWNWTGCGTLAWAAVGASIKGTCAASATLGSATVTSSGGTGPYTYSWTPTGGGGATASSLSAGTYTVTVSDAGGCVKTASTIINSTSSMIVTVGQTGLSSCGASNGTATASASGGVGPYTYLWNNGQTTATATGLSAGVYTVNVGDNGCSLSKTITISPPATINANITKTDAKCNGNNGKATSAPSGGSGPYTYSWGTSPVQTGAIATGLIAGTYTVTVKDAGGCTGTASVTINDNSLAVTSASTDPVCGGTNNGTASITATGGTSAYTYSWSSSPVQTTATATGLQGSTYIGTVTDAAGCSSSVTITINQPSPLLPEPKNTSVINCAGVTTGSAHVDVSGGTAAFTYLWSNGQTTQNITGVSTGTYTITVTDSKGCTGQNVVNVIPPGPLSLAYFPSNITGCNGDNTGSVTVNPTGGNPGYTYSWNTSPVQTTQSISGLTAGTYTVVVTDITGCTASLGNVVISQPAVVVPTTSSVPVGCTINNGSASATATGGTGSYTYLWAPTGKTTSTITGLSVGTYSVTVTDANGCSKTTSVSLANSSPPTIGISGSVNNVNCRGSATGSATVTATGGTGTLTYSWNNGVASTTTSAGGLTAGSYKVTVTDANGCSASQSIVITEPASVVNAVAATTNATCGNSNGTASVTASGGTPGPGYIYVWSPIGGTNTTATNLPAGPYTITVTDNNGCTKAAAISVNNSGAPTVGITSQTDVLCNGAGTGSATITATGGTGTLTYLWSPGGQTTATASSLTAGTYIVTVTDANNCAQGQSITIIQPGSAVNPSISSQSNVGCKGSATGSATVTATGGTGALAYLWSPGGQTSTTVSGLTSGTYSVTVTDANGCSKQQLVNITEPASALSSGIGSQGNVNCKGSATGSATITAIGGTGTLTYLWSPGGQTSSTVNGLTAGTYSVTVTDANGCSNQQLVTITQPASVLSSGIGSQSNVSCKGSATGSATITATGGTGVLAYLWSPGGQTSTTVSGLTSGTYSVTVTDANGCSNQQLINITEPASVLSSGIGSQGNVNCKGSATGSATITATGGTGTLAYSWSPGGQTLTTVSGLTSGTYSVTITDANGCSKQQLVNITEPASVLSSGIGSQGNVNCNGSATGSAIITAGGGTPSYTYNWSNGQTTAGVTGLTAGTYTVIVSDSNSCSQQQLVTITQPATSITTVSGSTNAACGSSNGTVSVTASGGTSGYTYNWSVAGQTNSTVSGLTPGTYNVIVTDANGCTKVSTATVNGSPGPIAGISSKTNITCNGLTNGSATVTVSSGTSPYIYTWNPNVTTNSSSTGLSVATYTVVVSDAAGCKDTTVITITQPSPLVFTLSASNATICAGESLTLLASTPTGGTAPFTFNWFPNGPVVSPLVPTTYSVTVTDSSGCISQMDTIRVIPLSSPAAAFDTLSSGQFHEHYTFTDKSTGGNKWYWDFGDGTTSTFQNAYHIYLAGTYTVTQIVTGPSGCTDTIIKVIVILPNILIPNVFTPNHDGINDDFWIPNTGFESFTLEIYNRWGTKLFETDAGDIRWDGHTTAGVAVSDGTYYYILKAVLKDGNGGGTNFDAHGFINLCRGGGK